MKVRHMLLIAGAALAIASPGASAAPKPAYGAWGVDMADMDKGVKPGDDFFGYVEGTWLKNHPIAEDKRGAGYNYDLPDATEIEVRDLVQQAGAAPADPMMKQVGDFYRAYMDQDAIESRGLAPLKPYLERINAVRDRHQLVRLMSDPGFAAPIRIGITADEKEPTRYTVESGQARLGLPTRDYYLLKGDKYESIRKAYHAYIAQTFELAGIPNGEAKADAILALETSLSKDQWTPEKRRDPQATYNPMNRARLAKLAPEFDWTATLQHMGLAKMPTVIVGEPSAVAAAGKRIADVPLSTWKDWMTFRFISDHAQFLPKAFDQANFAFYGKTLSGIPAQPVRWKRGVRLLNGSLGDAVGQLYIARHWTPDTERQVDELVDDMRAGYKDLISHASWMDEPTRKEALKKLASFDPRVGHPVKYLD